MLYEYFTRILEYGGTYERVGLRRWLDVTMSWVLGEAMGHISSNSDKGPTGLFSRMRDDELL